MFERGYTCELINLGYKDAMDTRDALLAFMAGEKPSVASTAAAPAVAQAT